MNIIMLPAALAARGVALAPDPYDELVGLIYDGAGADAAALPWAAALRLLLRDFDASWVSLQIATDGAPPQAIVCRKAEGEAETFVAGAEHAGVFALDPLAGLAGDAVATLDEVIDSRAWMAGEAYRHYFKPRLIRYILGGDLRIAARCAADSDSGGVTAACAVRLRIMRPASMRDFDERDKRFCRRLLPHLRRAVELRARQARGEAERELHAAVGERLRIGVIALDAQGRIASCNGVAAQLLAARDGLAACAGRLRATHLADDGKLQKLIAAGLGTATVPVQGRALALTRSNDGGCGGFGLLLRRLPRSATLALVDASLPRLALFIRDSRHEPEPAPDLVGRLFGLTPAESALALLLAGGASLDEAAARLDIRITTARAHLRAIFQKTGVSRQAMLVRLLLNSLATLG